MFYNTSMKPVTTVINSKQLESAVSALVNTSVLAIDTEFMREKTYFPKLCLLQIAATIDGETRVFLIDPLQEKLDLKPLAELWSNPDIVKVFHSGYQDLQILFDACGAAPRPYFDTQDAAVLIGQPEQIGYAALVERLLDIKLDKADSFTDWAKRPLSKAQLKYAQDDVNYLLQLYPLIKSELESLGRESWLEAEFSYKSSDKALTVNIREQYGRLKRVSSLKPQQLAIAREVAAWRESEAMRRNIPKRWLLPDESILEIARRAPASTEAIAELRGVDSNLKHSLPKILAAVKAGKACLQEDWPQLAQRRRLSGEDSAAIELMAAIVRKRAQQNRISSSALASRALLEDYVSHRNEDCALMQGWRKDLIGEELKRLLEGKICLLMRDNCLVIEEVKPVQDSVQNPSQGATNAKQA
ncbi:MAG: ribonuclease D [Coriobacteriia bacterium]|nr:ribonuclease D [Coriobacteriia bacterium]MCL2870954.1 ribonuclease D [Coriobacteriia bacterium]